ncbi:MAG: phosphoribosylanthranilate isomerase [Erythrobacter sp.]
MSIKIKICGLSRPEEIAAAANAGATHVGLVHFEPSPRHVSLEDAARLRRAVPIGVQTVLLVVDPDGRTLANAIELIRPDVIQFHGKEPPEALELAKSKGEAQVWKALSVRDTASLDDSAIYDGVADCLLFDAPAPEGSPLPGGNGEIFGWDILKDYPHRTAWGLAGGLNPDNVAEAIAATGARLVDVSSGVESAPGVKDVDKITAFCKAALDA